MTGTGLIIIVVMAILKWFGVAFDESQAAIQIGNALSFVGWTLTLVGQIRRKDLSIGLFRK